MSRILSIGVNESQLRDLTETLAHVTNGVPRAISGAINKVLPKARTRFVKAVGDRITVPARAIRERVAIRKATPANLEGFVTVTRRPIPLIEFKARQTKRGGVTVQVRKGTAREKFPDSFIATMTSGHTGVFRRRFKGKGRVPRLPIDERYGPTVLGIVTGAPGLLQHELVVATEDLQRQIGSQVDRLLQRKKGSS